MPRFANRPPNSATSFDLSDRCLLLAFLVKCLVFACWEGLFCCFVDPGEDFLIWVFDLDLLNVEPLKSELNPLDRRAGCVPTDARCFSIVFEVDFDGEVGGWLEVLDLFEIGRSDGSPIELPELTLDNRGRLRGLGDL